MITDKVPGVAQLQSSLQNASDRFLTGLLLLTGLFLLYVALTDNPVMKAAIAAWVLFP